MTAMKSILTSMAASSMFAALAIAQQTQHYKLADLGTLPSGTFSQATAVSDDGFMAGVSAINPSPTSPQHAILWYNRVLITDIGQPGLGGPNSLAYNVNELGQVVGQAETSTPDPNKENFCGYGTGLNCAPFLWHDGVMIQLPLLGGNNGTVLGDVNNHGQVPGVAENSTRDASCAASQVLDFQPVLWGPKRGEIQLLSPLYGDSVGVATWINDNGQAVGTSGSCANTVFLPLLVGPHAVLWEANGSAIDLGNLGGTAANVALSINNRGQVVGASSLTDDATAFVSTDAFLWTRETRKMQNLGTLPGDVASGGVSINDSGVVVGPSFDAMGNPRAFVWQNGVMTDLNTLVLADSPLYLLFAENINSSGEIAGFGVTGGGDVHAFLLTPDNGGNKENLSPSEQIAHKPVVLSENARKQLSRRLGIRGW